jgi:hypothetical protein
LALVASATSKRKQQRVATRMASMMSWAAES